MGLNLEQKQAVVAEVSEQVSRAQAIVLAEYRNLPVGNMTELRKRARTSGIYLRVLKNTLARRAVADTPFAGLTESFRGYDGIRTIAAAITKAGKPEAGAIREAFWNVELTGLGGKIKFVKVGPAGKESGQSVCNVYLVRIENGRVVVPKA